MFAQINRQAAQQSQKPYKTAHHPRTQESQPNIRVKSWTAVNKFNKTNKTIYNHNLSPRILLV